MDIHSYIVDKPLKRNNSDKHLVDKQGEALLNMCKASGLRILNGRIKGDRYGRFTRYPVSHRETPSTLDYIITDEDCINKISHFMVLSSLGISDHECLCLSITTKGFAIPVPLPIDIVKWGPFTTTSSDEFLKRIRSPTGREKINTFLSRYGDNTNKDVDIMATEVLDLINFASIQNRHPKHCKRKRKKMNTNTPWYSSECKSSKWSLNRAIKAVRKDPFDRNKKQDLFSAQKRFKSICKKNENLFRKKMVDRLLSIEKKDPSEFWNVIKQMKNHGSGKNDQSKQIDPRDWMLHFQSLLNEKASTSEIVLDELSTSEKELFFSEFDREISTKEIEEALTRLNTKSSCGPDKVSANLLCAGKRELMPVLKIFFNYLFNFALQPKNFTLNFLVSIYKKGEIWDLDNYRGIAIGSSLGKVFSLILLERLKTLTETSHPISPNQVGFQKNHRTSDHVFVLNTIVNKLVKVDKKKLYVAFIDFRKAYDKINRDLLLLKLQRIGVKGKLYENIKSIYANVAYLIKVKGGYLTPMSSTRGLKQGGVLSLYLFNLFIDDINQIFDESCDRIKLFNSPLSHLLYADDLILMSNSKEGLQECLNRLGKFCDTWQLELNITKSQVVIFNSAGRLATDKFSYKDKILKNVKSYCYLGVEFSCNGTFTKARTVLFEKANKTMFPPKGLIKQFEMPCKKSLGLFHTLIEPIALYNSENLAHLTMHQIKSIEEKKSSLATYMIKSDMGIVQQKFLKYILGVNRSCSNLATLGELGEFPICLRAFISILSFWHRSATQMQENTLVHQALHYVSNNESSQSVWFATVKCLLNELGLQNYLLNPSLLTTAAFKEQCKTKIIDLFTQYWSSTIQNQDEGCKLRFYKKFKSDFIGNKY